MHMLVLDTYFFKFDQYSHGQSRTSNYLTNPPTNNYIIIFIAASLLLPSFNAFLRRVSLSPLRGNEFIRISARVTRCTIFPYRRLLVDSSRPLRTHLPTVTTEYRWNDVNAFGTWFVPANWKHESWLLAEKRNKRWPFSVSIVLIVTSFLFHGAENGSWNNSQRRRS